MPEDRILILEDEADQRGLIAGILRRQGHEVIETETLSEARASIEEREPELILSDRKLRDEDGLDLLRELRANGKATPFILITAYGTIAQAVSALRDGADDYLSKPFERDALLLSVDRTLRTHRLASENRRLSAALEERDQLVNLMGRAPAIQKIYKRLEKLADTEATVLLTGESGTGKELAARALHSLSSRSAGPFIAVNCAAIPEGLIEAEFFGAERGAFTGADRQRKGKFEAAEGGTLFLDEVGELPLLMQPKLLRVLQEGCVTRVGGTDEIKVNVRILAATNRNLADETKEGRFREDLRYRLDVVSLHMPALRERRDDIPMLTSHFAEQAARRHSKPVPEFPPALLKSLCDHAWPGNVRELSNVIERLVLLAEDDEAQAEDLPEAVGGEPQGDGGFKIPPGGMSWEDHEGSCLRQAIELAGGNRARAARLLSLPYKAFLYRLEKHRELSENGADD